jgi:DNA-directed RNA polymerase specialized sigma24 family protein
MSISDAIAPHIPYLRRYARALTGSQKAGDAYVEAALEAIIADRSLVTPADLADKGKLRVALYRVLSRVWNSIRHPVESSEDPPSAQSRASPRSRVRLSFSARWRASRPTKPRRS